MIFTDLRCLLKNKGKIRGAVPAVLLLVSVLAGLSLFIGKYPLSLAELLAGNERQLQVFVTLRLSRTLTALIGGAALGLAGFIFQTVFRNGLASPDIIGISSGAGAGAAVGMLCFGTALSLTLFSFAGALLALFLTLLLASADRMGKSRIVLAGIAVHALFQALLMCLKLLADPERELQAIEYWIMGSLADISLNKVGLPLALCLLCMVISCLLYRQTVLLSLDEGEARMLGLRVGAVRLAVLLSASLMVSSVVSLTGLISFVGLLAPHGARLMTGGHSRRTMVLSALLGALLLTGADILARSVSASELPVSVFTSLIGAPVLVMLALGRREEA